MNRYRESQSIFIPLLLIALSLALNLHALATDSFWGDEILTAAFAGRSPADVIHWTAGDIHPPLYYLLAGGFTRLIVPLGLTNAPNLVSDWLWRFTSVIAGVLTVAVTYRLGISIINYQLAISNIRVPGAISTSIKTSADHTSRTRHHALFAALLLALAPIAIKYGQEARMHALFMFLSALSTCLLFRALARPNRWPRWLAFALSTMAHIYTMYFGFLILAAHAVLVISYWLLVINRQSSNSNSHPKSPISHPTSHIIGFTGATLFAGLAYLPWWPVLFGILRRRASVGAIEGGVGNPGVFIRGVVQALGPLPEPLAWGFLLLFIVGLIILARRFWPLAVFGGSWLVLPLALPIVLGDPRALQFRYAFVLPVYLAIIAYAVVRLGDTVQARAGTVRWANLAGYLIWLLATVSFIGTLGIYDQTKPDWRSAATYLDAHAIPADIILIGPLWDEGRFIDYYYRGQAQLLTPAALVTNIEGHAAGLRAGGGRVWAVNRFAPAETPVSINVVFPGVVLSEPQLAVYEPALLAEAAIDLAEQAADAAYPWAAAAEAAGVLNPDPRTAQAAALRAWGDALVAAGRPEAALAPYQQAVDSFPGWVNGFIALAETQVAVGNFPAAAEAYRQAVAFNLDWQGPQADEAAALVEAGQWSAALEKYNRIIRDN
ncbi:MAG TPA: glycosyltransferase family 39 protein [Anaerolineae bacterium]